VIIDVDANHLGFFVFALCENNNLEKDSDQSCFMKHRLSYEDESNIFFIPKENGRVNLRVKLPGKISVFKYSVSRLM
jgi:hypothetical protein